MSRIALGRYNDGIDCPTIGARNSSYDPDWPGREEWLEEVAPFLQLAVRGLLAVVDPTAIGFGGEAPADLRQRVIARSTIPGFDRLDVLVRGLLNSTKRSDPAAFDAALLPIKETVLV